VGYVGYVGGLEVVAYGGVKMYMDDIHFLFLFYLMRDMWCVGVSYPQNVPDI
jgi:hypothetical protein